VTAPADGAPATARVDLHSHSTASDGLVEPAAVVEAARRAGLAALALTDHDTVDGVAAAREAGERLGVRVVPGAELSAHLGEEEIHLLALHMDDLDAMAGALARFRDDRVARAARMVELLVARGIAVSMDDVLREAAGGAVGRPHVARAVVAAGGARDLRDAFDRLLGNGRPASVDKPRLAARDAIRLVHEAGGLCIWAHPGPEGRRAAVEPLVEAGLDGLEVLHPRHGAEDEARLGALVDFFGLVSSGGSDWHGTTDGYRVLGQMQVPLSVLEAQDARVHARRRAGAA
jgi:hypothetical protein